MQVRLANCLNNSFVTKGTIGNRNILFIISLRIDNAELRLINM